MRNSKGKSYILFDKLSSANPKIWSVLEVIFFKNFFNYYYFMF